MPATTVEPTKQTIVAESAAMQSVTALISAIAPRRTTVLILGETGTGKEVVARAIHALSPRALCPFVAVNCAAIPNDRLEAELFGQMRGAYYGADPAISGRFELAQGGTLFLDEIGAMPLELQSKLLRVLQEREFQRLGSPENIHADVRVLAATNVNLEARVRQGRFREDLYYRLHVIPIVVPALRERKEDIPQLAEMFLDQVALREGMPCKTLKPESLETLAAYSWPGNVRQMENAIEMAAILSGDRLELEPSDFMLPRDPREQTIEMTEGHLVKLPAEGIDFARVISRIELDLLEQALERTHGNKKMAADLLRLKRTTLAAKLKTLGEALAADWNEGDEEAA